MSTNLCTVPSRPHPGGGARLRPGRDSVWFCLRLKAKRVWPGLGLALLAAALSGCSSSRNSPAQDADAARALFDSTTKDFHLPSAEAHGPEQARLLAGAAAGYQQLLRQYPHQSHPCAQATRSLANVRATQGHLDEAVKLYARVAREYPGEDFEILMSWKCAADLLADAGRGAEAKPFYEMILDRFDQPDAAAVVKTVLRGSRARLNGPRPGGPPER